MKCIFRLVGRASAGALCSQNQSPLCKRFHLRKATFLRYKAGIKLPAARGQVQLPAQSNDLETIARKDLNITSNDDKIDLSAAKEILLVSGGAYVRIKDGNVELHAPGKVEVNGAMKTFDGPTNLDVAMADFPEGTDCATKHRDAAAGGASLVDS